MAGLTFLRVVDNATMMRQEQEAADKALAERQNQPMILGIAAHLRQCWDVAQQAKKPIEQIMLRAMRNATASMKLTSCKPSRVRVVRKST